MLKHTMGALACAGLIIGLSSCASHLSEAECTNMNWKQLGFGDGSAGKYPRTLQKEVADCSKFKIPVDQTAYHNGWRAGTRQFCQPQNGYNLGVNGQTYNNVCPSDRTAKFTRSWHRGLRRYCTPSTAYNLGRSGRPIPNFCASDQINAFRNSYDEGYRIHQRQANLQGHVGSINGQLSYAHRRIEKKQHDIRHWQDILNGVDNPSGKRPSRDVRRQAHMSIRQDRRDIRNLQRQIENMQMERSDLQNQITQLQA